ncbi:MAG: type-F conjugative transfer system protein TraW [Alphaproteobacteria bacterium]|nr:type-F conjugative transfer system protein TraW [Alphaproteobacteria bacterium]
MKLILFLICFLLQCFTSEAFSKAELQKDFGVVGATFEIMEEDLLEVIEQKLEKLSEDGSLQKHQQKIALEVQEKIKRPKPVVGIQHAKKARVFTYDLSLTVPYDLKDHQGKIFHAKDTKVNPLDFKSLSKPLVFIDGNSGPQVEWAIGQEPLALIILTNGSPFELMEKLDRPVYFDQEGVLTKKLGILQVPAKVTQQEKHLLIEEVVLKETGEK